MTPEAKLLAACKRHVKSLGPRCWCHRMHTPGTAGVPDLVVVAGGYVLWIELKSPGEKPTRIQTVTHERIRLAGGIVAVVNNLNHFAGLVEAALADRRTYMADLAKGGAA